MSLRMRVRFGLALAFAMLFSPSGSFAAKRPAKSLGEAAPASEASAVELFTAIAAGQVEAKFIAKNSERGRLLIKNNTRQPLSVRLPQALAAAPVLAQFQLPGFPGGGNNGAGPLAGPLGQFGNGAPQTIGAGINGNRRGLFGAFSIPPDRTLELKVACVCLEHGKPNPRPAIPYRLVPIESVSQDPPLHNLLAGLSEDRCSQRVAQAAAWHLANEMSWEQLAAVKIERLIGLSERYFSAKDLKEARDIVEQMAAAQESAEPMKESLSQR